MPPSRDNRRQSRASKPEPGSGRRDIARPAGGSRSARGRLSERARGSEGGRADLPSRRGSMSARPTHGSAGPRNPLPRPDDITRGGAAKAAPYAIVDKSAAAARRSGGGGNRARRCSDRFVDEILDVQAHRV